MPFPAMRYHTWHQDWKPLVTGEAFLHDAAAVAKTSAADLDSVIAVLDAAPGFLGPESLRTTVGSVVKDAEQARGVASFILNLNALQRQIGESFLADFQRDMDGHAPLNDSDKATIRKALPRLLSKRPAIERHAKAEALSDRLGPPLHHFSITCDLRPVFDEKREVVEGMFPVATLKVETYEPFSSTTLTASLSGKQIERILEETTNAQKKLAALRSLLAEHQIVMPESGVQSTSDNAEVEDDAT